MLDLPGELTVAPSVQRALAPDRALHGVQSLVTDVGGVHWAVVEVDGERTALLERDGDAWVEVDLRGGPLAGTQVERITIGPDGRLWVAAITEPDLGLTDLMFGGPRRRILVASMNPDGWSVLPESPAIDRLALATESPSTSPKVVALEVAPNDDVWVGFGDDVDNNGSGDSGADIPGLLQYRGGEWVAFETPELPTNDVLGLTIGVDGALWVMLDEAGCEVERETFTGRKTFLECDAVARYDGLTWAAWGPHELILNGDGLMATAPGELWILDHPTKADIVFVMFDGDTWYRSDALPLEDPGASLMISQLRQQATLGIGRAGAVVFTVDQVDYAFTPSDPGDN